MIAAIRGSYVEFVYFMGGSERYPPWFCELYYESISEDEHRRFTFYKPLYQRSPDYYDKELVEDYSVFVRKPDGEVHVMDYDNFEDLYTVFSHDRFTNSGIAAYSEDCIEYVECAGGTLSDGYPEWFYEYFTEALNFPSDGETLYFFDEDKYCITASRDFLEVTVGGEVTVTKHCVFLHNKFGEVKAMTYFEFKEIYDDNPDLGG